METEDSISPYVKSENEAPNDHREIYPEESKKYIRVFLKNGRICELCKQTCTHGSTSKKDLGRGSTCNVSDVDFTSTKESVICSSCLKSLDTHRGSLESSLNAQDKTTTTSEMKENPYCIKMEEIEMKTEEDLTGITPEFDDRPRAGQATQNRQTLPDEARLTGPAGLEKLRHMCDKCDYGTNYRHSLERHLLKHKKACEVQMYMCHNCHFQSKYKKSLVGHQLVHKDISEVKMYACGKCDYKTKRRTGLTKHLRVMHRYASRMYNCDMCDFETKFRWRFILHTRKKHKYKDLKEGTFTEDSNGGCSKEVEPFELKAINMVTEDSTVPYVKSENEIPLDQPEFYSMETDKDKGHLRAETNISESKYGPISLKVEEIEIKSEENEVLDTPGCVDGPCIGETSQIRQETNKTLPVRHKPAHEHISHTQKYQCDECSYKTKYKSHLDRHLRKHKDVLRMYKCDLCDFESGAMKNVNRHTLLHDPNPQVYKCDQCNFQTIHKGSLVQHQLVHRDASEVQMYKCDTCCYETKYRRSLVVHMQTAMHKSISKELEDGTCSEKEERPPEDLDEVARRVARRDKQIYKCQSCDYQTTRKTNFLRHQLVHKEGAEVKMFKCDECSFQTKHKDYLVEHQLVHKDASEIQIYKCETCNYATKHKKSLARHMRSAKHKSASKVQKDGMSGK